MRNILHTKRLFEALAMVTLITSMACGEPVPEAFDATLIRRDTGFVPFDGGTMDHASNPDTNVVAQDANQTTPDASTTPDTAVLDTDAASGSDSAIVDSNSATDAAVTVTDATSNVDAASDDATVTAGLGESCTEGTCPAPLTCAIPSGQTQGFCLEPCSGPSDCGRSQVCESVHETVPGNYCLDVVTTGGSCMEIYSRCMTGNDCYVTNQDADGNPSEALCKDTCDVADSSSCADGQSCVPSGYVDMEHDANGDPVMCANDPGLCGDGFTCMDLRTSDGRVVQACATDLGWCGTVAGPGDSCNEDQDLYCGEMSDPNLNNDLEAAFGICADQCWYICLVPVEYTSDGQEQHYDCADGMACVPGPAGLFPAGVGVCDHGFDAGVVIADDAGAIDDAGAVDDAGTIDDAGTEVDASGTDAATNCTPCGDVTFIGACDSDQVTWCDGDGCLRGVDCSAEMISGAPLHCAEFSQDWGFDCLAAAGQGCNPDYPEQPSDPNAPSSPGCDPSAGTCNSATFICGTAPDGGFPVVDGGDVDAGAGCMPCELNDGTPVSGSGACQGTALVWCGLDDCLAGFDCADDSRSCSEVTVNDGTTSYPWADCFGGSGQACVDGDTYFNNLDLAYEDPNWLCDPDTSCDTTTNTCL